MAILKAETHGPCRVFDANGVELQRAVWADTETGEAAHYVVDEEGRAVTAIPDHGKEQVKLEWLEHPAPLRWEAMT